MKKKIIDYGIGLLKTPGGGQSHERLHPTPQAQEEAFPAVKDSA
jgi:hypothetical protein